MRRCALSVDAIVRAGVGQRYTAAVLRVERGGRLVHERAFGGLDDSAAAAQTDGTTPFDLASLTKVFVATAALREVAEGRLELDAPLAQWLTEWRRTNRARVTLRMLLAHTAGLQSGADYRTLLHDDVERFALLAAPVAPPGERVVYSDLGFIVLGVLLARVRQASLATVIADLLARLECEAAGYRPRNDRPHEFPATEEDAWRGRVRGSVHDEKAALLSGVAGHAGLFGTARDVARVSEAYLGAAHARSGRALPGSLALEAISEQAADPVLRRGLGWALKTSDENSCGAVMDGATFGHTGFTGTCVWADPRRDLSIVLLTNAVYYGRRDLRDLRAAVCDACVAEFA